MAALNRATLIGNLGADPEVRYTPTGVAVANFRVATNEFSTDKDGKKQEHTEWHRVVVRGKLAELCGKHLAKGRQVYVEGRLQTREWEGKDKVKHHTTEVLASSVQFLGSRSGEVSQPAGFPEAPPASEPAPL